MGDQDQKLCDKCHERPATNHICHGGGGESRSLCEVCLLEDSEVGGLWQRINEAVRVGHCKYCGAPSEMCRGGSSSVSGEHFNLVCRSCFDDLADFARKPENAVLFKTEDKEALRNWATQFPDFQKRQNEYMRQRVLERKSKR